MTTSESKPAGWLLANENADEARKKDYSLDKSIGKITPESIEDEAKNIKLVRAVLFKYGEAGNDIGATLNRRLQIVEGEKKSDDTLFNKLLQIVEDEKKSDDTLFNKLSKLVEDGKKSDDTLFNELSKLVEDEKKSNDTLFNRLLSLVEGEKKSGTKKTLFKRLSKLVEAENKSDTILLKRLLDLVKYQKESITKPYFFIPLTKDAEINPDQTLGLPSKIDLSKWFCKVQSQGVIPSCTAHAGISLMEYFQNRISGDTDWSNQKSYLSWRFLYRVTRNLEGINQQGDESKKLPEKLSDTKGATIRQTLKAMVLFGVPPENSGYWTWGEVKSNQSTDSTSNQSTDSTSNQSTDYIDEEPSSFLYAYAQNYQATNYFRLDKLKDEAEQLTKEDNKLKFDLPEKIRQKGSNEEQKYVTINELILIQVRISIASGFPCIFGIKNTSIFENEDVKKANEPKKLVNVNKLGGGHALVAVGYDDKKLAFKVRNSWGDTWGDHGYFWLPYKYLLKDVNGDDPIAINWWSMLDAEWIDFGKFGLDIKNGELEPLMGSQGFMGGRWWTSLSPFK